MSAKDESEPSVRLVEQRIRNRIMEEIWTLSQGDAGVLEAGLTEWFEAFFDWFPYEGEPDDNPAMTPEEAVAVREVCKLMQEAIADTDISRDPTVDEVIRTDWPLRVAPVPLSRTAGEERQISTPGRHREGPLSDRKE
ncbi:MAG TPA: hypothetical protein VJP88_01825 [Caulobacteraceae bacterium]|nr:hypothetical protein [Caulobacteraceae bacterium]